MKSIKEKAKLYGLLNPDIHYNNNGNSYDNHYKPAEDFEAGANYVLGEIEKLLPKEDKNLNDYGKALVWRIKDTIEQLKSNQ